MLIALCHPEECSLRAAVGLCLPVSMWNTEEKQNAPMLGIFLLLVMFRDLDSSPGSSQCLMPHWKGQGAPQQSSGVTLAGEGKLLLPFALWHLTLSTPVWEDTVQLRGLKTWAVISGF